MVRSGRITMAMPLKYDIKAQNKQTMAIVTYCYSKSGFQIVGIIRVPMIQSDPSLDDEQTSKENY